LLDAPVSGIVPKDAPVYIISVGNDGNMVAPVVLSSRPPKHAEPRGMWPPHLQDLPQIDLRATLNSRDLVDEEGAGINVPAISSANPTIKPLNGDHPDKLQPSKMQPSEANVQHSSLDRLGTRTYNHTSSFACEKNALVCEYKLQVGRSGRTGHLRKTTSNGTSRATNGAVVTTMMLRNIPCKKSQEEILRHIDEQGYEGKYDFFHLPKNEQLCTNLGYSFINFISAKDAARFEAEMTGFRFASTSAKRCVVVPAHVQGLSNNLTSFKRNQGCQHLSIAQ